MNTTVRSRTLSTLLSIAFIISTPLAVSAQATTSTNINSQIQNISTQLQILLQQVHALASSATTSTTTAPDVSSLSSTLQSLKQQIQAMVTSFKPNLTNPGQSGNATSTAPHMNRGCGVFMRNLSTGSRGDDVMNLQQILSDNGFLDTDSHTGYFGPATRAALTKFQTRFMGVASSSAGDVGPMTRHFLQQMCDKFTESQSGGSNPMTWNYPTTTWDRPTSTWPTWNGPTGTELRDQLQTLQQKIRGMMSTSTVNSSGTSNTSLTNHLQEINQKVTSLISTTAGSANVPNAQFAGHVLDLQQQIQNLVSSATTNSTDSTQISDQISELKEQIKTMASSISTNSGQPSHAPGCMPRPACLDATPRCMLPEPASGWCPAGDRPTSSTCGQIQCFRYDPVCGTNGTTYSCGAADAQSCGTQVAYAGVCRPSSSGSGGTSGTPPVACTMDAHMCPDGSYVGRTGPNCAFVCPTQTSSGSGSTPTTPIPPTACNAFSRALSVGTQGTDVSQLQQILASKGLLSADNVTGYFGPLTQGAVQKLQSQLNISSIGTFGPATRSALLPNCSQTSAR